MSAQELKHFTLEDLNFGGTNFRDMQPQNKYCTWWGNQLVRLDRNACYLVDKKTGKETELMTLAQFNKWAGPMKDIKARSLMGASFPFAGKPVVMVQSGDVIYMVDFKRHNLVDRMDMEDGEAVLELNTKSGAAAILKDDNLYVKKGDSKWQLSEDGSRDIVYGQAVHRDEFGIRKGTYFSPDGEKLAFYRMDQSMVTDYPQVEIPDPVFTNMDEGESVIAKFAPSKYPMAGETSHKVTVGVFDMKTGKTVYLKAGDPTDRYFTNIAWSPDGESVYMITSTELGPMLEVIYRALEKNFGLDGIDIVYSAEEPGNQLFITNDESVADTYYVEIDDEAGEQVLGAFGVEDYECDNYSEEYLVEKLKAAFGIGEDEKPTIDELLDTAAEHPGIYIYLWEYEPLTDTF